MLYILTFEQHSCQPQAVKLIHSSRLQIRNYDAIIQYFLKGTYLFVVKQASSSNLPVKIKHIYLYAGNNVKKSYFNTWHYC